MTETPTHTPLPCPICRCAAVMVQPYAHVIGVADEAAPNIWMVHCDEDAGGCELNIIRSTQDAAIAAWNTRADSHHRLVEALREAASALGIVEAQHKGGLNPILKRAKDNADAALKAVDHG